MPEDDEKQLGSVALHDEKSILAARERVEQELTQSREALRASEARYRSVVEGSLLGIIIQHDGRIVYANPAMAYLFGYPSPDDMIGLSPFEDLIGEDPQVFRSRTAAAYAGQQQTPHQGWRARHRQGKLLWISSTAHKSEWGGRPAVTSFYLDITERKQAEARLTLLNVELQHRTKNLLGVVQAIASRTLTSGRSIESARKAFIARLHALGHANELLSHGDWQGASLHDLIDRTLDMFAGRYSMEGERVVLNATATQGFALAIHELCTNAHKHGAFSTSGGRVAIRWTIDRSGDARSFLFRWQESGGPPVTPPERRGFGTTLLEVAIGGAEPRIEYAPDGLAYALEAPLDAVVSGADEG